MPFGNRFTSYLQPDSWKRVLTEFSIGAALIMVFWLLGIFQHIDGFWFDRLSSSLPESTYDSHVAVVEYSVGQNLTSDQLNELVKLARNTQSLGLLYVPRHDSDEDASWVDFNTPQLSLQKITNIPCEIQITAGMARYASMSSDTSTPCLLAALSKKIKKAKVTAKYLSPDFRQDAPGKIPQVNFTQLASNQLVSQTFKNRWVFISEVSSTAYVTPWYNTHGLVSANVWQAALWDAQVQQHSVRWLSVGISIVLGFILAAAFLLIMHRFLSIKLTLLLTAIVTSTLIASAGLLYLFNLFLPVSATLVCLFFAFTIITLHRQKVIKHYLHELEEKLKTNDSGLSKKGSQAQTIDWEQLHVQILEFLPINKSVLLHLKEASTHLEIVSAIDTSDNEIYERRRDVRRSPYATAVASGAAIHCPRPFFDEVINAAEYITPLLASGQLLGFWVFTLESKAAHNAQQILEDIPLFSDEIARCIFRERYARLTQDEGASSKQQLLKSTFNTDLLTLADSKHQELFALKATLQNYSRPIAIYNANGDLQFTNHGYEALAKTSSLPLLTYKLIDLLTSACKLTTLNAMAVMREILHKSNEPIELAAPNFPGILPYTLLIQATQAGARASGSDLNTPFNIDCIIIEIATRASDDLAYSKFSNILHQQLKLLNHASNTAHKLKYLDIVYADLAKELSDTIDHTIENSITLFDELDGLRQNNEISIEKIRLSRMIYAVTSELLNKMSDKGIGFDFNSDENILVTGNELNIKKVLRKSLILLLEDADQDSNIKINVSISETSATLELFNHGVGVPAWHIENAIHNISHRKADKSALQQLADETSESDMALSISSTLGEGYRITMAIPTAST